MRGQTIRFGNVRRGTKHIQVGRKCWPISKKWDALMAMVEDIASSEHNRKLYEGK